MSGIDRIMRLGPVIPVLVVEDPARARPLAEALVKGGLRVLEVTRRTPAALEVIREMTKVISALKALAGPFGDARFCPTGGITEATAPQWLALEAVLCVGGTWLAPGGADDAIIFENARSAAKLAT